MIKLRGPVSYECELEDGRSVHRHLDQLRAREAGSDRSVATPLLGNQPVPLADGDQGTPTQNDQGNSAGDPETPVEPTTTKKNLTRPTEASGIPPVRHSACDRKGPDRLDL